MIVCYHRIAPANGAVPINWRIFMYIVLKDAKVFAGLPVGEHYAPEADGLMWNDWPPRAPSAVIVYPSRAAFDRDCSYLEEQGLILSGELVEFTR